MKHSRPGYATRSSDQEVARLNDDMIPALHRQTLSTESAQASLAQKLANRKLPKGAITPPAEVLKLAEQTGPQLILNHAPSATPQVLEPGK